MTGSAHVIRGDARRLPFPDASIDAVVCDPPYGIEFMGRAWDSFSSDAVSRSWNTRGRAMVDAPEYNAATPGSRSAARTHIRDNPRCRKCGRTINGRDTDKGFKVCHCLDPDIYAPSTSARKFQDWCTEWAAEVLRVLRPGGHLLAFGGSRTFHRLACAIEDAGFEIRDSVSCLSWVQAQGFAKSLNVSRVLDQNVPAGARCACAQRSTQTVADSQGGYPLSRGSDDVRLPQAQAGDPASVPSPDGARARSHVDPRTDDRGAEPTSIDPDEESVLLASEGSALRAELQAGVFLAGGSTPSDTASSTSPASPLAPHRTASGRSNMSGLADDSPWRNKHMSCPDCGGVRIPQGLGTALSPAWEPIIVARKPLAGTVAQSVLAHGTGAINIDGTRVGDDTARADRYNGKPAFGTGEGYRLHKRTEAWVAPVGRWPKNLLLVHHPDCDEVCVVGCAVAEMDQQSGLSSNHARKDGRIRQGGDTGFGNPDGEERIRRSRESTAPKDFGGASRYFPVFRFGAPDQEFFPIDLSACPLHGAASTRAASTSAGSKTESSADSSRTDGSGSKPTDPSPTDTRSTTETTTRSTTNSPTSCALPPSGTTTTTPDSANSTDGLTESNSDDASDATSGCLCRTTTSAEKEPGRDTAGPASVPTAVSGSLGTATNSTAVAGPVTPLDSAPRFKFEPKADTWERPVIERDGADGMQNYGGYGVRRCDTCGKRSPATGELICGHDQFTWTEPLDRKPGMASHPTVKPVDLMRWLVRLVTPPGGTVLDPFCGSGATIQAAKLEGMRGIGIDSDPDSVAWTLERLSWPVRIDREGRFERIKPQPAFEGQGSIFDVDGV